MSRSVLIDRLHAVNSINMRRGTNRPGLSGAEHEAHRLVGRWLQEDGLELSVDAAGNLVARLFGSAPELGEVWAGSHLDTVPEGGQFDGALGVLAAADAVSAMRHGPRPRRTVAVVVFRDEEGTRFGRGLFGSRAMCQGIASEELESTDVDGISVADALSGLGLSLLPQRRTASRLPHFYVEAHIEQGPRLVDAGLALGAASGIIEMAGCQYEFTGRHDHAGTTPMETRADALAAAAAFALDVHSVARARPGAVGTVGEMGVIDGASNVVPSRVRMSVDIRSPNAVDVREMLAALHAAAEQRAHAQGCRTGKGGAWHLERVEFDGRANAIAAEVVRELCGGVVGLQSGAGHDAAVMSAAGVDTALVLVRSANGGASHSPDELTSDDDVRLCAVAVQRILRRLADE